MENTTESSVNIIISKYGGDKGDWKRVRKVNSHKDTARVFENRKTGERVTVWIAGYPEYLTSWGYTAYHVDRGDHFPENLQMEDKIIQTMNKIVHSEDYFNVYYNPKLDKVWLTLGDGGLPDNRLIEEEPGLAKYTSWEQMEEIFKDSGLDVRVEAEHDPTWYDAMEFLDEPDEYEDHMTYFGYYPITKAKGKYIRYN